MAEIYQERMTAEIEGEVVVFLIGMRINKLWKIHKWLPVAMAMRKMLKELDENPDLGCLGYESLWFGNPTIMVQYWRSFDALDSYARNKSAKHLPAWANFNRHVSSSGDVGIWHETYCISQGSYECIYTNMPQFGLGKVGKHIPATGKKESATGRMGLSTGDAHP